MDWVRGDRGACLVLFGLRKMSLFDEGTTAYLQGTFCNFFSFVYIKEKNNRLRDDFKPGNAGKYQKMDLTK